MGKLIYSFLFFMLGFSSLHAQKTITWKTLEDVSYTMQYDSTAGYMLMLPVYGDALKKLEGKEVIIKGYILPMDTEGSEFVLSAFPFSSCFFCGGGGKESVLELELFETKAYSVDQITTFKGILNFSTDPFGLNYVLSDAQEVDEAK